MTDRQRDKEASGGSRDLSTKVAIVTGGARGIGGAVARLFAARGMRVLIADILEPEGVSLAAELGERTAFHHLDVTSEDEWKSAVAEAQRRFGQLDVLVNCAGILIVEPIISFDRASFDKVLQINLTGTFLGIKHSAPAITASGGGAIINISSTEGLQGSSFMGAYAASKWGVRGLTKVAAMELGPCDITVNSVHPGPINTPMVNPRGNPTAEPGVQDLLDRMPIKRVAEPSEVAELCAYLASDAARFVTAAEITIDGGLTTGMFRPNRLG